MKCLDKVLRNDFNKLSSCFTEIKGKPTKELARFEVYLPIFKMLHLQPEKVSGLYERAVKILRNSRKHALVVKPALYYFVSVASARDAFLRREADDVLVAALRSLLAQYKQFKQDYNSYVSIRACKL